MSIFLNFSNEYKYSGSTVSEYILADLDIFFSNRYPSYFYPLSRPKQSRIIPEHNLQTKEFYKTMFLKITWITELENENIFNNKWTTVVLSHCLIHIESTDFCQNFTSPEDSGEHFVILGRQSPLYYENFDCGVYHEIDIVKSFGELSYEWFVGRYLEANNVARQVPSLEAFSWNEGSKFCPYINGSLPIIRSREEVINLGSFLYFTQDTPTTAVVYIGIKKSSQVST